MTTTSMTSRRDVAVLGDHAVARRGPRRPNLGLAVEALARRHGLGSTRPRARSPLALPPGRRRRRPWRPHQVAPRRLDARLPALVARRCELVEPRPPGPRRRPVSTPASTSTSTPNGSSSCRRLRSSPTRSSSRSSWRRRVPVRRPSPGAACRGPAHLVHRVGELGPTASRSWPGTAGSRRRCAAAGSARPPGG